MAKRKDIDYGIKITFNKTKANIEFENSPKSEHIAHGIALMILAFNNQVDGDLNNTIGGIFDAIKNINGDK